MELVWQQQKNYFGRFYRAWRKWKYIKSEDIPNIDLYMDQVLTFMDQLRSASTPADRGPRPDQDHDQQLCKNDLLPPPVKKYSRNMF